MVEINYTLKKKKSMLAQETSGIQVHQVKSIRLQRFLLLFHFSVQLGIAGLLNTIPGRSSVQFSCSVVYDSLHPMDCSFPGFPVHHQLRELAQTHVCWVGDVIQSSHPLSSPFPPAFNLSQHQGLFQWVYSSHQVAKLLEFQLQHQSFQWISGLISFRMDWFDLLAVQGTLKSLRQHCNSKASILREGETSKAVPLKNWNEILFEFIVSFWHQPHNKCSPSWRLKQGKRTGTSNHISWAFAASETADFS